MMSMMWFEIGREGERAAGILRGRERENNMAKLHNYKI
jgi:hypothetical protein